MKKSTSLMLSAALGAIAGIYTTGRLISGNVNEQKNKAKNNFETLMFFIRWMEAKQAGGSIEDYLYNKGYRRIMMYGVGYIGERLIDELEESKVEIVAAMDRASVFADVPVIKVDDSIPDVDCIVVTPVYYFEEIKKMLLEKTALPILSISEIIDEL